MRLKVTSDKKFLQVTECAMNEIEQLEFSMTKKIDNWFILRKKFPHWDGDVKFIDHYQRLPIGLWQEVYNVAKKFHFPLEVEGIEHLYDKNHDFEAFEIWALEYFAEHPTITPRDYQIEGANRILKFKNCTEEISTSGGKTLIAFLLFKYFLDIKKFKKMLYVVPNIGLVTQTEEKFYEYEDDCGNKPNWKSQCAFGGAKKELKDETNIVFGTYQTLAKKDLEYFGKFDVVCIDECLHPDTLITMEDFSKKKIKDIKKEEKVWTYNENKNVYEIKEIDFVYKNLSKNNQMFEIEMEDGSILNITGNHKVLTKENGWVKVDELSKEEEIISFGIMKIKKISKIDYKEDVYNLRIKADGEYNHNYFANGMCVSNCHHSSATSIKNILVKCYNAKYKFGVTGTLPPEDSLSSFTIQSYIGPKVYTVYSADLIASNTATPINVYGIELDYLEPEMKKKLYDLRNVKANEKDGVKLLNLEKDVARENRKRLIYICEKIASSTKNSLVLFSDIKNDYGRKIFNWLKDNTEKNVYYIDGGTKADNRDYYKKQMEIQEDTIIVASAGTFSEGISINNLHNIFIVESYKSMFIIRQILGRGMRLMEGKEKVTVLDFIDNYEYGSGFQKTNYLMRHGNERERIYKDKKFPYKRFKVKL